MVKCDVSINLNGVIKSYSVLDMEGHFVINQNGELIAIIEKWEDWEQTAGDQLDDEVFEQLIKSIERNFQ